VNTGKHIVINTYLKNLNFIRITINACDLDTQYRA